MMDSTSETRLSTVHPALADKIRTMAEMLSADGIIIRVTQALRTWAEQQALWQKGRDDNGNVVEPAAVVTHARPGYSYHNFGLAVDVAPFDDGLPDWNEHHPVWQKIVAVGESLGLTAGAEWRTFPDFPHFQLVGSLPVSPDSSVRDAYTRGGIDFVWKAASLGAQSA